MIRFACEHCGRQLTSRPENVGRSMTCPGCRKSISITTKETGGAAQPGKSNTLLLALLGTAVLLAVVALVLWWFNSGGGSNKLTDDGPPVSDMVLLAPNAQSVVMVRAADLLSKPAGKDTLSLMKSFDPKQEDIAVTVERETSLKLDDIERFHYVGTNADKQEGWAVVKSSKPLDRDKILAKLKERSVKEYAGRRYYLGKNSENKDTAVHFANPTVLVVSDEGGMQQAMTQASKPVTDGPLKPTILLLESSKSQVIMGWNGGAGGAEILKQNEQTKALADVKHARLTVDADQDIAIEGRAQVEDENKAAEVRSSIAGTVTALRTAIPLLSFLKRGEEAQALKDLSTVLAAMKTEVKGKEVIVTYKGNAKVLVNGLVKGLPQLQGK